ncbi:unnamed protein product [Callosobruchus maculatus]|nr:unnamed protein product [Callosobruchus maculatus]
MQPAGQHFGFGTPDGYSGYNNQAEIIDVSPEIFREEMRKLGILQRTSQRDFSEMQPQFSYADIQVPSNSPPFNDLPLATGPYYQSTQYIPGLPIFPYAYGTPYGIPQSNMVPQMVYTPVNNASTQNVQDGQTPSFPYPQVQAETPPVGPIQPEFTYIPTYQYKNQPAQPIVKKRRHRHRYVIKKDSSQNNGNQSESRVIDKHEVQRKTYSFR